ncbi:MAG: STAS domain-containing protein [Gammaproteobacteria bacterium]|nr:STAS domain-containing protein [Gammaproteobacteria bacterium]
MDEQHEPEQVESKQVKKMVITCESNVDISVAKDFYELLMQALAERQLVEIDASQVERVDGSILQLLYAFWKEAGQIGLPVSFKAASTSFVTSARLLGMDKSMNLS